MKTAPILAPTGHLPAELWQAVSAFLSPRDRFMLVIDHIESVCNKKKRISIFLLSNNAGKSISDVLEDMWKFNQPEFAEAMGSLSVLCLPYSTYRLSQSTGKQLTAVRSVIKEYIRGSALPLWKYLPRGLRSKHRSVVKPLGKHTVTINRDRDGSVYRNMEVFATISISSKEVNYMKANPTVTTWNYTQDKILLGSKVQTASGIVQRYIEVSTGECADITLGCTGWYPSERAIFMSGSLMGGAVWFAGSRVAADLKMPQPVNPREFNLWGVRWKAGELVCTVERNNLGTNPAPPEFYAIKIVQTNVESVKPVRVTKAEFLHLERMVFPDEYDFHSQADGAGITLYSQTNRFIVERFLEALPLVRGVEQNPVLRSIIVDFSSTGWEKIRRIMNGKIYGPAQDAIKNVIVDYVAANR